MQSPEEAQNLDAADASGEGLSPDYYYYVYTQDCEGSAKLSEKTVS